MKRSLRKGLSIGLSVIFLSTNVVLAAPAQANIWAERQAAAQVASVPAHMAPGLSGTAQKIYQSMAHPAAAPAEMALTPHTQWSGLPKTLKDLSGAIPKNQARIQDIYAAGNASKSPIVILQDIHLNAEAQTNMAAVLQSLIDQDLAGTFGIEGAFGPFNIKTFRNLADRETIQLVADSYLKNTRLAAPSYVGVVSEKEPPAFVGIDDRMHYDKNVAAYLASRDVKATATSALSDTRKKIHSDANRMLSGDLRTLFNLQAGYHQSTVSLKQYFSTLSRFTQKTPLQVETFLSAAQLEGELDFEAAGREQKLVVQKLAKNLTKDELNHLLGLSMAYQAGRISFGNFYGTLRTLCQKKNIGLSEFPHFSDYVRYVMLADAVRPAELFTHLQTMEQDVLNELAPDPAVRTLFERSEWVELAQKLTKFSLTPEEWTRYQTLNDTLTPLPISGLTSRLRDGEPGNSLQSLLEPFETFYREAHVRSEKMVENLLAAKANGPKILVTGGFHTPEIAAMLKQRKISHMIVSPKMTRIPDGSGSDYLSVFAQEKTPIDKLFEGRALFINPETANLSHPRTAGEFGASIIARTGTHLKKLTPTVALPFMLGVSVKVAKGAEPGLDQFELTMSDRVGSLFAVDTNVFEKIGLAIIPVAAIALIYRFISKKISSKNKEEVLDQTPEFIPVPMDIREKKAGERAPIESREIDGIVGVTVPAKRTDHHNEDRWDAEEFLNGIKVAAVFDGAGGHNGAEEAAEAARQQFKSYLHSAHATQLSLHKNPNEIQDYSLANFLVQITNSISEHFRVSFAGQDSKATGVIVILMPDGRYLAMAAGDARAYTLVNGSLESVTLDNDGSGRIVPIETLRKTAQKRKQDRLAQAESPSDLSELELNDFKTRNYVSNIFESSLPVEPLIIVGKLPADGQLILMSDGVHDPLTESEMEDRIRERGDRSIPEVLVRAAFGRYAENHDHMRHKENGDDATAVILSRTPEKRDGPSKASLTERNESNSETLEPAETDPFYFDQSDSGAAPLEIAPRVLSIGGLDVLLRVDPDGNFYIYNSGRKENLLSIPHATLREYAASGTQIPVIWDTHQNQIVVGENFENMPRVHIRFGFNEKIIDVRIEKGVRSNNIFLDGEPIPDFVRVIEIPVLDSFDINPYLQSILDLGPNSSIESSELIEKMETNPRIDPIDSDLISKLAERARETKDAFLQVLILRVFLQILDFYTEEIRTDDATTIYSALRDLLNFDPMHYSLAEMQLKLQSDQMPYHSLDMIFRHVVLEDMSRIAYFQEISKSLDRDSAPQISMSAERTANRTFFNNPWLSASFKSEHPFLYGLWALFGVHWEIILFAPIIGLSVLHQDFNSALMLIPMFFTLPLQAILFAQSHPKAQSEGQYRYLLRGGELLGLILMIPSIVQLGGANDFAYLPAGLRSFGWETLVWHMVVHTAHNAIAMGVNYIAGRTVIPLWMVGSGATDPGDDKETRFDSKRGNQSDQNWLPTEMETIYVNFSSYRVAMKVRMSGALEITNAESEAPIKLLTYDELLRMAEKQSLIKIGRDPASNIVLDDASVSRTHASLYVIRAEDGLKIMIQDLGSSNGTYINLSRVSDTGVLFEVPNRDEDPLIKLLDRVEETNELDDETILQMLALAEGANYLRIIPREKLIGLTEKAVLGEDAERNERLVRIFLGLLDNHFQQIGPRASMMAYQKLNQFLKWSPFFLGKIEESDPMGEYKHRWRAFINRFDDVKILFYGWDNLADYPISRSEFADASENGNQESSSAFNKPQVKKPSLTQRIFNFLDDDFFSDEMRQYSPKTYVAWGLFGVQWETVLFLPLLGISKIAMPQHLISVGLISVVAVITALVFAFAHDPPSNPDAQWHFVYQVGAGLVAAGFITLPFILGIPWVSEMSSSFGVGSIAGSLKDMGANLLYVAMVAHSVHNAVAMLVNYVAGRTIIPLLMAIPPPFRNKPARRSFIPNKESVSIVGPAGDLTVLIWSDEKGNMKITSDVSPSGDPVAEFSIDELEKFADRGEKLLIGDGPNVDISLRPSVNNMFGFLEFSRENGRISVDLTPREEMGEFLVPEALKQHYTIPLAHGIRNTVFSMEERLALGRLATEIKEGRLDLEKAINSFFNWSYFNPDIPNKFSFLGPASLFELNLGITTPNDISEFVAVIADSREFKTNEPLRNSLVHGVYQMLRNPSLDLSDETRIQMFGLIWSYRFEDIQLSAFESLIDYYLGDPELSKVLESAVKKIGQPLYHRAGWKKIADRFEDSKKARISADKTLWALVGVQWETVYFLPSILAGLLAPTPMVALWLQTLLAWPMALLFATQHDENKENPYYVMGASFVAALILMFPVAMALNPHLGATLLPGLSEFNLISVLWFMGAHSAHNAVALIANHIAGRTIIPLLDIASRTANQSDGTEEIKDEPEETVEPDPFDEVWNKYLEFVPDSVERGKKHDLFGDIWYPVMDLLDVLRNDRDAEFDEEFRLLDSQMGRVYRRLMEIENKITEKYSDPNAARQFLIKSYIYALKETEKHALVDKYDDVPRRAYALSLMVRLFSYRLGKIVGNNSPSYTKYINRYFTKNLIKANSYLGKFEYMGKKRSYLNGAMSMATTIMKNWNGDPELVQLTLERLAQGLSEVGQFKKPIIDHYLNELESQFAKTGRTQIILNVYRSQMDRMITEIGRGFSDDEKTRTAFFDRVQKFTENHLTPDQQQKFWADFYRENGPNLYQRYSTEKSKSTIKDEIYPYIEFSFRWVQKDQYQWVKRILGLLLRDSFDHNFQISNGVELFNPAVPLFQTGEKWMKSQFPDDHEAMRMTIKRNALEKVLVAASGFQYENYKSMVPEIENYINELEGYFGESVNNEILRAKMRALPQMIIQGISDPHFGYSGDRSWVSSFLADMNKARRPRDIRNAIRAHSLNLEEFFKSMKSRRSTFASNENSNSEVFIWTAEPFLFSILTPQMNQVVKNLTPYEKFLNMKKIFENNDAKDLTFLSKFFVEKLVEQGILFEDEHDIADSVGPQNYLALTILDGVRNQTMREYVLKEIGPIFAEGSDMYKKRSQVVPQLVSLKEALGGSAIDLFNEVIPNFLKRPGMTPEKAGEMLGAINHILAHAKILQPQSTEYDQPNEDDLLSMATHLLSVEFDANRLQAIFDIYFNSENPEIGKQIDQYDERFKKKNPAAFYSKMDEADKKLHRQQTRKLDYNLFIPFMIHFINPGDTTLRPEAELFFKLFTSKKLHGWRMLKMRMRIQLDLLNENINSESESVVRDYLNLQDRIYKLRETGMKKFDDKIVDNDGDRDYRSFVIARDLIEKAELFFDMNIVSQIKKGPEDRDSAMEWRPRVIRDLKNALEANDAEFSQALAKFNNSIRQFQEFYKTGKITFMYRLFNGHIQLTEEERRENIQKIKKYATQIAINQDNKSIFDSIVDFLQSNQEHPEVIRTMHEALMHEVEGNFHEWRTDSPSFQDMLEKWHELNESNENKSDINNTLNQWLRNRYYVGAGPQGERLYYGFTDNFSTLLNLGNPYYFHSCQACYKPAYNRGLSGYMSHGDIKALVVFDEAGNFLARRIVRLKLNTNGELVLMRERTYGKGEFGNKKFDEMLAQIAAEMGVRYQPDEASEAESMTIYQFKGHSEWEYSDSYGYLFEGQVGLINITGEPAEPLTGTITLPFVNPRSGDENFDLPAVSEAEFIRVADRVQQNDRSKDETTDTFQTSFPEQDFIFAGPFLFYRGVRVNVFTAESDVQNELASVAGHERTPFGALKIDQSNRLYMELTPDLSRLGVQAVNLNREDLQPPVHSAFIFDPVVRAMGLNPYTSDGRISLTYWVLSSVITPIWETTAFQYGLGSQIGLVGASILFIAAHVVVLWLVQAGMNVPDAEKKSVLQLTASLILPTLLFAYPFVLIGDPHYARHVATLAHMLFNSLQMLLAPHRRALPITDHAISIKDAALPQNKATAKLFLLEILEGLNSKAPNLNVNQWVGAAPQKIFGSEADLIKRLRQELKFAVANGELTPEEATEVANSLAVAMAIGFSSNAVSPMRPRLKAISNQSETGEGFVAWVDSAERGEELFTEIFAGMNEQSAPRKLVLGLTNAAEVATLRENPLIQDALNKGILQIVHKPTGTNLYHLVQASRQSRENPDGILSADESISLNILMIKGVPVPAGFFDLNEMQWNDLTENFRLFWINELMETVQITQSLLPNWQAYRQALLSA